MKELCNVYFTKLFEDDRIPANIDIDERLWTGRFGAKSLSFICRNRFLYLGTTVKCELIECISSSTFFCFFYYQSKSLSIYFGHHSLAFLNSFLNISNKYVLTLLGLGFLGLLRSGRAESTPLPPPSFSQKRNKI